MKTKLIIMAQLSLSALLISAATTASLSDAEPMQLKKETLQVETRSALMKLASVRPGSFDAIDHNLHQDKNLRLRANIANVLQISDHNIRWTISKYDQVIRQLQGNSQSINLPTGSYVIKLTLGKYNREKQVTIRPGQQIQPYFNTELAALKMHSNQIVDWAITGTEHSYRINSRSHFNELLPAGNYTVSAVFGDVALQKEIHIKTGQRLKAFMDVPLGQVRLMATKDSQPLFKAVAWDIYRITGGKRHLVGEYQLHSRSIAVPPGHYEAVASYDGKSGRRQFRVREGGKNNVILALN